MSDVDTEADRLKPLVWSCDTPEVLENPDSMEARWESWSTKVELISGSDRIPAVEFKGRCSRWLPYQRDWTWEVLTPFGVTLHFGEVFSQHNGRKLVEVYLDEVIQAQARAGR